LLEEINITENMLDDLRLRYITLRRTKGEIRQNYYFFAELKADINIQFTSNEGISKWFEKTELNSLDMPFTSKYVIEHYLNIGDYDSKVYGGIADGEKVVFVELPEF
jgi:8-oxo-dGTP diphosphatase